MEITLNASESVQKWLCIILVSPKHFSPSDFVRCNLLILLLSVWIYFGRRGRSKNKLTLYFQIEAKKNSKHLFSALNAMTKHKNSYLNFKSMHRLSFISNKLIFYFSYFFHTQQRWSFNLILPLCSFVFSSIEWMEFRWMNK